MYDMPPKVRQILFGGILCLHEKGNKNQGMNDDLIPTCWKMSYLLSLDFLYHLLPYQYSYLIDTYCGKKNKY